MNENVIKLVIVTLQNGMEEGKRFLNEENDSMTIKELKEETYEYPHFNVENSFFKKEQNLTWRTAADVCLINLLLTTISARISWLRYCHGFQPNLYNDFGVYANPWGALVSNSDFLKKQGLNVKSTRFLYSTGTRLQSIDCEALLLLKKDNDGGEGGHVAMRKETLLWNPSTRVVNTLPQIDSPPFDDIPPFRYYWMLYGFGYDSTTDDYKVVFSIVKDLCVTFAIFSLRKGSWGTVSYKHLHSGCADPSHGCLLNGVLHRLDLEPDEWHFGFLPHFYGRPTPKIVSLNLADSGGGVIIQVSRNQNIEKVTTIWVMNEYGVYDSWTKLVQIPSDLSLYNDPYIVPISILENGEVLISDSSGLVLYNPKEKTVRTVLQLEHRADCALTYVETLVSPVTGI
ncbi:hypothetical protein C1H46_043204 [Malus baccata]|uniref:F-box associated beta-propeller type 3 domain-containing protein n=1 Tax=Malus baccata TaxID=106549 RepID=A0A540KAU3_MALBA|nr:hypothetical protein C1H46_043204 [Malus baccata]